MLNNSHLRLLRLVALGFSTAIVVLAHSTIANGINGSAVDDMRRGATSNALLGQTTPTSPGIPVGTAAWDEQHPGSQGHQVARNPGDNIVHFVWINLDHIPTDPGDTLRQVYYNVWDDNLGMTSWPQGTNVSLAEWSCPAHPRIDIDGENRLHFVLDEYPEEGFPQAAPFYQYFPVEGLDTHLTSSPEPICTDVCPSPINLDVATQDDAGIPPLGQFDVVHIVGVDNCYGIGCNRSILPLVYAVFIRDTIANPDQVWTDPVVIDSLATETYVIDAVEGTGKVAIAFTYDFGPAYNGIDNIVLRESHTGGDGWLNGAELGDSLRIPITNYTDPSGPQAYRHISIAYDHNANLHVIWDEQLVANQLEQVAIKHWNDARSTIRTVVEGYYPNTGVWDGTLNLTNMTLGIGDGATLCSDFGTNEDFLYVAYSKLCGETPAEQADTSIDGLCNSELYITISPDGGANWSAPVNLTNTKTPNCDPSDTLNPCASEDWATIGRDVSGIDIVYILDRSPGPYYVSGWTMNPVMYIQLPGGVPDAERLCPDCICSGHGDPALNGALVDVFDVVAAVDIAFRSGEDSQWDGCPRSNSDVTGCDEVVDVFDVVALVDVAFRNGSTDQFCDPCL